MQAFNYTTIDKSGNRLQGQVEAISKREALNSLRRAGHKIINISPAKKSVERKKLSEIAFFQPKIKQSLKILFFRELATLVKAEIPISDALSIVKYSFDDKYFLKSIDNINNLVKSGYTLSFAMSRHSRIFSKLSVSLLSAAEIGGGMGTCLGQIASYIESDDNVSRKLKSATAYPKFIAGFFMLVLIGVLFVLLPKFKDIYDSFGAELPASTQVILSISNFMVTNWIAELLVLALLITGFKMLKKSKQGEIFLDRMVFSIPIFGPLLHNRVITRFSRTLSILIQSGVTLPDALKMSGETVENEHVFNILKKVRIAVIEGRSFGHQLTLYPKVFPMMVSSMISVGEQSGALLLMLEKISEFSDTDFNTKVERLSATLEPMMMAGLGVVICVIVLTLYLPIFQLSDTIK